MSHEQALARFDSTVLQNPYVIKKPHVGPQARYLMSPRREALYGGAARSGKSIALLQGAAQDVQVPGYAALILRSSLLEHYGPEGLITESKLWWLGASMAEWNNTLRRWLFPSGATIHFGYLEKPDDIWQYRGSAYHYIAFDELTDFDESPYTFLFTRQSRPKEGPLSKVPLRMRSGSNPGGKGTPWVRKRFIEDCRGDREFVRASVSDNPSVDEDEYRRSMDHVDELIKRQYLDGDWYALPGGRVQAAWLEKTFAIDRSERYGPGGAVVLKDGTGKVEATYEWRECYRFMTCDPASSARDWTKSKHDPDYTAVCTWMITPANQLLWLSADRVRLEIPDIVPFVENVYSLQLPAYVAIEALGANRAVLQLALRTRMVVRPLNPLGRDKLTRLTPWLDLAKTGRMYFCEHGDFGDARAELLSFTGDGKTHDDYVDNCGYATDCMVADGREPAVPYGEGKPFVIDDGPSAASLPAGPFFFT